MGLSNRERDELRRLWRPGYGAAEVEAFAKKYGVSARTIWRLSRASRPRARRADRRRDAGYAALLGEELIRWCVGQLDEGVALRDVLAAAHDLQKPRHELLSPYRLRRAFEHHNWSVAASRARGEVRPDGSRAPMVKRAVERLRANTLHQYDETRAPQMYVDLESGDYVYDSGFVVDWRERQPGRAPLWVAQVLDDASRARHFVPIPTPSAESVLAALAEAWLPKADPLLMPFYGLPEQIYGDNGSWLSSETVREALRALGVKASFHEPHHPWAKGKVERSFHSAASFYAQERLTRSRVEETREGRTRRILLRMTVEDLPEFFLRLNLLANNRAVRTTGEASYARWVRLVQAHPETFRAAPPAEVFQDLALARFSTCVRPDVSVRLPGGERIGLDWSVFGGLVAREVLVRYRRLERGRETGEGEKILIEVDGQRWEAARRAPAPERRLVAEECPRTAAERLSEDAARVDYFGEDLTRHAAAAPTWALGVEPKPFDAGAREALEKRIVKVGRYEAIERLQRAGRLSTPLSETDRRLAAAWLPGDAIDLEKLEHLVRHGRLPDAQEGGASQAASA